MSTEASTLELLARLVGSSREAPGWPELAPEARHGLVGELLELIEPHTEADPVAILVQFLTCFGSVVGRGPHFRVEADRHGVNLYCCLVGETAKGRKGTSTGHVRELFASVDEPWERERVQSGLASGEGLIWAVRDPVIRCEPIRERGRPTGETVEVTLDPGVADKRLCVFEGEFALTLRVLRRDTNTLSAILRHAWDRGDLRSLTKNSPAVATGAHVSLIAHVTRGELLRYLDTTEAGNGFGNRFLWLCVRRSKCLPEGGSFAAAERSGLTSKLTRAVELARGIAEVRRNQEASIIWRTVYPDLSEAKPGLLGAMIARAEAQVMRLACLYALLDGSPEIRAEHLYAALALWDYAEQSARYIFGGALGDPVADEILEALRGAEEGLTRSDIRDLFGRHRKGGEIARALSALEEQGLAVSRRRATGGRPVELWTAR